MRKTNNLPWMGRTVATAIMVLVGLAVFAGSAAAQATTTYQYAKAAAWWDNYDCDEMRLLLGMADLSDAATGGASMSAACKPYAELTEERKRRIQDFINPAGAGGTEADHTNKAGPHKDHKTWWTAVVGATPATTGGACSAAQTLMAMRAIPSTTANDASTASAAILFCRSYDLGTGGGLLPDQKAMVMEVGNILSGRMMDEPMPTPTPAVPLVGIGILGLLLAGRGAWLRRRTA